MKTEIIKIQGKNVRVNTLNTVVVGTGAAGYNAAITLIKNGVEDIAIVTEGVNMGTSRNTGSDKQTYYKLNLCAADNDSPHAMAQELFAGRCVDGDTALCEAANSVRSFLNLCELGVEFPTNRYGEYVGYKTDHDTRARATSTGPLTSKMMTEALEKEANRLNVKVIDKCQAVEVLSREGRAVGLICLDIANADSVDNRYVVFIAQNIIFATGGPAGIYSDTVYPVGHAGSTGVMLLGGARGQNLTEWQYGLASIAPRWNVSGTYMQVLPKFVSVDEQGNEYEFLSEYYTDNATALSMVFKKGYEWPFDSRKANDGSSIIDLLVYRETAVRGRRVYLDFRTNPFGLTDIPFESLSDEATDYLKNAGADFGTPIQRLAHMNNPAIELYASKGVDLNTEMLEISLCAQHNNGGIAVDLWWQSSLKGLFAAGECAGTHGVYRPGGSALNAGQVGSLRSALYVSQHQQNFDVDDSIYSLVSKRVQFHHDLCDAVYSDTSNVKDNLFDAQKQMSDFAGAIRVADKFETLKKNIKSKFENLSEDVKINSYPSLRMLYRLRDTLVAQYAYVCAMQDYFCELGATRGSALYSDAAAVREDALGNDFAYKLADNSFDGKVQQIKVDSDLNVVSVWREVRPLPDGGGFFENVWRDYRENKNIN